MCSQRAWRIQSSSWELLSWCCSNKGLDAGTCWGRVGFRRATILFVKYGGSGSGVWETQLHWKRKYFIFEILMQNDWKVVHAMRLFKVALSMFELCCNCFLICWLVIFFLECRGIDRWIICGLLLLSNFL